MDASEIGSVLGVSGVVTPTAQRAALFPNQKQAYTQRFNHRSDRVGDLFQGQDALPDGGVCRPARMGWSSEGRDQSLRPARRSRLPPGQPQFHLSPQRGDPRAQRQERE
jgi:hypothetical protein